MPPYIYIYITKLKFRPNIYEKKASKFSTFKIMEISLTYIYKYIKIYFQITYK